MTDADLIAEIVAAREFHGVQEGDELLMPEVNNQTVCWMLSMHNHGLHHRLDQIVERLARLEEKVDA